MTTTDTYFYAQDPKGGDPALVLAYTAKLYDLSDAANQKASELQAKLAQEIIDHHASNALPVLTVATGGMDLIKPGDTTGLPEGVTREIEVRARMFAYVRGASPDRILSIPGLQSFRSKTLDTTVTLSLPTEESERERKAAKQRAHERDQKRIADNIRDRELKKAQAEKAQKLDGGAPTGRHSQPSTPPAKQLEWDGDPNDYFA